MTINYIVDYSVKHNLHYDFIINYEILSDYCGGIVNSLEGVIASPTYSDVFSDNIECIWTIQASSGNKMAITILDLDLFRNVDGGCEVNNYLEIHDNNAGGELLDVICGSINDTSTRTYDGFGFWMKYSSSSIYRGRGFELKYKYCK